MALARLGRELGRRVRENSDVAPFDRVIRPADGRFGIPLGYDVLWEQDLHARRGVLRGIEIKDRSFHSYRAEYAAFEISKAKAVHKTRQICGTSERPPRYGLPLLSSD